jgi:fatty-acyl-CoA synthase
MVLQVPPTLVAAVRALAHDTVRGFTFVRPDGSERHVPFAEICREAEQRAGHFVARGLTKGQRVALVIPDGDEFVLSFLGATFAGLVPVPIYPQLSFKNVAGYHETVRHIVKASGARFLLTTATTKPYVDPVLEASPGGEAAFLERIETVDAFAVPASEADVARARATDVHPDDLAFLQFTSGSTARPKGVAVTHGNLAANSEAFMIHGLGKDSSVDKGVSWLPLFHDMGLIGFVIGPLFTDIPVVFLPTASFVRAPRLWLETIHKHRGTITYAPNFAYALVSKRLKDKEVEAYDLSCLRRAGCGAEPIQAKTLREFASKLAPAKFDPRAFLPSYGMAEATLAVSFVPKWTGVRTDVVDARALETKKAEPASLDTILRAEKGDTASVRELVNCGRAFPGHEIAIVDADDASKRLGDRQVGEIITRGPSICQGYYQEPELTAGVFKDGWLHTGDLGYLVDGEVFICGRAKDVIIVRGRNFYPSDIEWTVSELPGIRRGNVVAFSVAVDASGAPTLDGAGDDQLVLCAEGFQSDAAALTETIKSTVAAEHGLAVHDVVIVPQGTLPRTSSGKPQRRKTKQMYQAAELPRAQPVQRSDAADASA